MSTGQTTSRINVFIFKVDTDVEGRLVKFATVQVDGPQRGMTVEQTGWLTYIRNNGTPPQGKYYVFANGHTYNSTVQETPTIVDTGVPTS